MAMMRNLDSDFHEIFPPTDWPIKHFEAALERRAKR
jgi:hypothetical protein